MNNHTDTFQPSDHGSGPNGKELFGFVTSVFYLTTMVVGVFWGLLCRRGGSIGTRTYWMDFGLAQIMFLALRQFFPYSPSFELFTLSMGVMTVMYLYHLIRTLNRKDHVHTQCIGTPFFSGERGELIEWAAGVGIGLVLVNLDPGLLPYGVFLMSSSTALALRAMMISERDRLRSVQMEDALWENEQMMKLYEHHKKGNS